MGATELGDALSYASNTDNMHAAISISSMRSNRRNSSLDILLRFL